MFKLHYLFCCSRMPLCDRTIIRTNARKSKCFRASGHGKQAGQAAIFCPVCFVVGFHQLKATFCEKCLHDEDKFTCAAMATTTEQILCCKNQSHAVKLPGVDAPAFGGIDAGGVDAGMAQNVRQPVQVLFHGVISVGKEMSQVVGEHFTRLHPGAHAQPFHVPPDVAPVHRLARACHEYRSGGDFFCLGIFFRSPRSLSG